MLAEVEEATPSHVLGSLELSTIFIPLLPDYGYNMTACLRFLLPCFTRHDGLHPETLSRNKPSLPAFVFVGYFVVVT